MKRYLKLDEGGAAAFSFTEREKDYGGIHLCVPISSAAVLLALTDELTRLPPGHSRSLPLLSVPDDLPRRIVAWRRYRPLGSLRVGTAADAVTRIQTSDQAGTVSLSPNGLAEFKRAITLVHRHQGDLLVGGDSGSWTDRLWLWPL